MSRLRAFALLVTALCLLSVSGTGVAAATKISRSPLSWRTFWNCSNNAVLGLCAPYLYSYDGLVRVTYTSTYDSRLRANVVTITEVDQSVSMYGAGNFGNPCGIGLGITVQVYDSSGRQVAQLTGTRPGSYIYSPSNVVYGRVSNPNLKVVNPTFRASATAASGKCFNLPSSLSWSFNVA